MTQQEQEILKDMKAFIDRCMFEDRFEPCIMALAQDASDVLMDINSPRQTAGECGRIII